MNRISRAKRLPFFALLTVIGLCSSALLVSAADPQPLTGKSPQMKTDVKAVGMIRLQLAKVHLEQAHVRINKRTPVEHQPLEMVDPKTGKKVSADTMIEVGGKKVKAGEYYGKLNDFEKKFNALGYTLRDKSSGHVDLQESAIDKKELNEHGNKLVKSHLVFNSSTMRAVLKREELEKKHSEGVKTDGERINKLARLRLHSAAMIAPSPGSAQGIAGPTAAPSAPVNARTTHVVKPFNYTIGNKKIMAAYLNGKLEVKGTKDNVTVLADARAGGYLVGRELNLIKANGSVSSSEKGTSRANLHVYLLGQHVINFDKTGNGTWSKSDQRTHGIDIHKEFHFAIGPIPMTARLGARGQAGVRYLVAVRPAHATFQVIPFVDAKVYAQAGVNLFLVSGGVGGELTLLKNELRVGADIDLHMDSVRGPYIREHYYAQNRMNMLSGRVYAWARVNYLFGSKEWRFNLFNWKGIQANGYLFNVNRTTYLIPNYSVAKN